MNPPVSRAVDLEVLFGSCTAKLELIAMRWENTRLAVNREVLQHEDAAGVE